MRRDTLIGTVLNVFIRIRYAVIHACVSLVNQTSPFPLVTYIAMHAYLLNQLFLYRYLAGDFSNMAIVDVEIPSGYIFLESKLLEDEVCIIF